MHIFFFSVLVGTELKVNYYCFFIKSFVFYYVFMPDDGFRKAEICSMFRTIEYVF
jgi:hypothetical protein